ncbi:CNP1-like family protein [Nitrosomonas sp.]|uniref:CNP1-like family protein n=1 Tax=Nitrosomonas sp. TaxID=42353 RepID=UPI00272F02FF|nr:CNP1-like family protein [Nitrosomonas sp.]MDP1787090.1 CNP1-like family protein [Nitrosomonas sp.]MDP2224262.1 CNP1-like family protein [Nitrosomonas sp.]
MKRALTLICVLFLFACAKPAFKDEFESDKPWVEQLTQLPAYPDEKNLMAFDAGAVSDNQYFVDTTSIKIGEDGVIRFSLIIKSSAGALNVSYEGIRCATRERKVYALGRNDKTWTQPRVSEWQKLDFVRQFYAQRELSKNIFCPHQQIVSTTEEAIQALKAGMHRNIFR